MRPASAQTSGGGGVVSSTRCRGFPQSVGGAAGTFSCLGARTPNTAAVVIVAKRE